MWTNLAFSRDLKQNYSWLPKGSTSQVINLNISGTWSIIAGIWLDGQFLWMLVHSTVDSKIFQKYMSILKYAISKRDKLKNLQVTITLDNATIHNSDSTIERLKQLCLNVDFLPAYSPMLAPVEIFFKQLKSKFRSSSWIKILNIDTKIRLFRDLKKNSRIRGKFYKIRMGWVSKECKGFYFTIKKLISILSRYFNYL